MEDEVAEDRWEESKAQEAVEQSEFSVPQSIYLSWIRPRVVNQPVYLRSLRSLN